MIYDQQASTGDGHYPSWQEFLDSPDIIPVIPVTPPLTDNFNWGQSSAFVDRSGINVEVIDYTSMGNFSDQWTMWRW